MTDRSRSSNMQNDSKLRANHGNENKKYKSYQDYVGGCFVSKDDTRPPTNNRITGGKFHIPDDVYEAFLDAYYRDIVSKNADEYLTEKQRDNNGPIAIDIDIKHDYSITERQYTDKHIASLLLLYLEKLKKIFQFQDKSPFQVYVFEKPKVNRIEEKQITKDGIHIIIGIQSDRTTRSLLRKMVLESIEEEWGDLSLNNTWEDVFDKGVCEGSTGWQMYGSRKPNHDKYVLTRWYEYEYDSTDGEFMETKINIKKFDFEKDFKKLSVRYTGNPHFFFKADFIPIYEQHKTNEPNRSTIRRTNVSSNKLSTDILSIRNKADLDEAVLQFLESLNPTEYNLREAYEIAMILPESYYGLGSYENWMKVGWALSNISKKLLIAWIAFSSKSSTFTYDSIPDLCERWLNFDTNNDRGLTKRSLIYWARESNPTEFYRIYNSGIDYHIDQSIKTLASTAFNKSDKNYGCGDADLAKILHMMFKDSYVCAGLKADKWYRFAKHRWVEDECGTSLRRHISDELRTRYRLKCDDFTKILSDKLPQDDGFKKYENLSNKVLEICVKLAQTTHKDHVMKEAREFFFDPDIKFLDLLDSNPYLLCFKNGVLDIKEKVFRNGRAEDYLSKCTNIDYKKLDRVRDAKIIDEINDFMEKLFPLEPLRKYMWQHLASVLVGVNLNQKLHMYVGKGENGKSVLTDLLSQVLGDYKYDAVLSLITQARQKQGQASPDIVGLKGVRYAVMQEPSKNDIINDGAMKELTSGVEPIKGRNLFSAPVSFIPQFKIVVCTNNFMKVNSQDHGTWRRIAVVDFMSLFTDTPQEGDQDKPFQFKKDESFKEKFPLWREVFMAMLVEIVLETQGRVDPCKMIDESSLKYKEREDHIAEFIRDKIVIDPNAKGITKTEVTTEFNHWFSNTYGRGGPSTKEVHEYLDKRLGRFNIKLNVWSGARIRYERDDIKINLDEVNDSDDEVEDIDESDL